MRKLLFYFMENESNTIYLFEGNQGPIKLIIVQIQPYVNSQRLPSVSLCGPILYDEQSQQRLKWSITLLQSAHTDESLLTTNEPLSSS